MSNTAQHRQDSGDRPKRVRRTPEQAKQLILENAAERLKQQGLEGLNLTGVAEDAGISHATIIHHFGSSDGMRQALAEHMTATLLQDVMEALQRDVAPEALCQNLFRTIVDNGHARLMAWLAVDGTQDLAPRPAALAPLFEGVIEQVAQVLHCQTGAAENPSPPRPEDLLRARNIVLLVATTAIGLGIGGDRLGTLLGMADPTSGEFPGWLADLVTQHADDSARSG
ncbi:MAG: TetR/AcrR family transcriptional regulator [Pseudomonadota bacterium]